MQFIFQIKPIGSVSVLDLLNNIMSYTIEYKGTQEEKDERAMKDIRSFLGNDLFERIEKLLSEKTGKTITRKEWHFSLSFVGIQGYPCEAWARKLNITLV